MTHRTSGPPPNPMHIFGHQPPTRRRTDDKPWGGGKRGIIYLSESRYPKWERQRRPEPSVIYKLFVSIRSPLKNFAFEQRQRHHW